MNGITNQEAIQHHTEHGVCEDHTRHNVICTVLGGDCGNCDSRYEYCSETDIIKESCDCHGNKNKWSLSPYVEHE